MIKIYSDIAEVGKKYNAEKIVLFGSRARRDNRARSDIDIAVYGIMPDKQALFRSDINELPTLLDFDIVFVNDKTDTALLNNIKKDGVIIMGKFKEKYEKLVSAVERLDEAVSDYEKVKLTSVRDGVIQRFEFCTELAWKTLREYLIEQGYTEVNSPKSVLRLAFSDGIVDDEQGWLNILDSRNITSHVYDEETADTVFRSIKTSYTALFKKLTEKLKQ